MGRRREVTYTREIRDLRHWGYLTCEVVSMNVP